MRLSFVAVLAAVLVFELAGCRTSTAQKSQPPAAAPKAVTAAKPAPDFSLKDVQGRTVRLSDFKGKVVVIDFWATWCPPCRSEIPHLVDFYHKYRGRGLTLIGISVDDEGIKAVKPFAQRHKMDYPVLLADGRVQDAYNVEGIPTKVIVDGNGNIAARLVGYQDIPALEKKVLPLLR